MTFLFAACAAFVLTMVGTALYRPLAVRYRILANPNFRSLHQRPVPRGGGVVFAFVAALIIGVAGGAMPGQAGLLPALVGGGLAATMFGFLDDVTSLSPPIKLACHGLLAAWNLWCFNGASLVDVWWLPAWIEVAMTWVALVWLINLYNFVDGIDGFAAGAAVVLCLAALIVLSVTGGHQELVMVISVLCAASAAFLVFNWPPASIFMGDAGSVFLGYILGVLAVTSVASGTFSVWTWWALLGYVVADTTTTTTLRIFVSDRWYGEHRSHAYQNLARIWQSHRRVVGGILVYQALWAAPLAVLGAASPELAPLSAAAAVLPAVAWTVRYGPLLSSS
ncbi:MAG: hypothetical protein AMXMBFR57_34900 [Acidimicrobiia bacterium]